ncbi:hypothetical protein [Crassaminicella indica]|uniref:Uncharacterized protein n=1 Tax=Crassaminicella indica TaxID=2855394 RepID=A0ABX8RDU2_9CLOT|nr:hypothetical protein [Crassaminicella indica]QXM07203.1 hypothetical protein KVH43_05760 [Crassaminicella indica]
MKRYKGDFYKRDFDYEEDAYDRLKAMQRKKIFTNKSTMKKYEFDYEEDPYEPIDREE